MAKGGANEVGGEVAVAALKWFEDVSVPKCSAQIGFFSRGCVKESYLWDILN